MKTLDRVPDLAIATRRRLLRGWNHWSPRSVLRHVLMPGGAAVSLGFKHPGTGAVLEDVLPDASDLARGAHVRLEDRSTNGAYTRLSLTWRGMTFEVCSAAEGESLWIRVRHVTGDEPGRPRPATLLVWAGFLWNQPGHVRRAGATLWVQPEGGSAVTVVTDGAVVDDRLVEREGPYLAIPISGTVRLAVGTTPMLAAVDDRLTAGARRLEVGLAEFADRELARVVRASIAWNTTYDPANDRVISPVARPWSMSNGGWVLFCWDTFFAGYLASFFDRDIARANVLAALEPVAELGFVPNTVTGSGFVTRDRSQPPVGALMVRAMYARMADAALVEASFDRLLRWNRWWGRARCVDGLLAWGSNPYPPRTGNPYERPEMGVGGRCGGALESGLDNTPMYDDVPFDADRQVLCLHDVGLNGLYVADCEALADLADVVGRSREAHELRQRGETFRRAMQRLWCDKRGAFLNRRTDTGEFSPHRSPTLFYALLGGAAREQQAVRMVREHLLCESSFWGEWVLPSIARDDSAFEEQDYWRGRIWPSLNYLVWLGLRRYPALRDTADRLAERCRALLMVEWQGDRHIHENYCARTGAGCNSGSSNPFYHWGALLALPGLLTAQGDSRCHEPSATAWWQAG